MLKATKIRIYPNQEQQVALSKAFGSVRWLWNRHLADTQFTYKQTGKGLGRFDLNNRLPKLKEEFPWLKEIHSQVLQGVSLHLSRSFVNFFERRAQFPRFKSKHQKQSMHYCQGVKISFVQSKVYLPKIGWTKAILHRDITGHIKTVTVSKTKTNKYFASILTDNKLPEPDFTLIGKSIGIDVGLNHLAITSDGSKFSNPRFLKKHTKNLKIKQRKLSRKKLNSKARARARLLVAKVHERITNSRMDNLHKISRRLVNENQVIAVEDLNVKGLLKNHKLAKSISDVGWSTFVSMLKYKTKESGKVLIQVGRFFPSSKTCSNCMHICDHLPLDIRSWVCPKCDASHDRDINAAKNILQEAKRLITVGTIVPANRGDVRQAFRCKSTVSCCSH